MFNIVAAVAACESSKRWLFGAPFTELLARSRLEAKTKAEKTKATLSG
jgi:hypothetical protein